ncbi:hypothetical protein [Halobacillus sp. BBL2006]|uniref:hypothetical protein n=1 Tax=Halobacillus sp. BBL2006 TaxID=1543706 RepID=UPI0005440C6B|nr:hypothetical protein [Halobacillus sp. BBL2006]KHE73164.1 hypothetical protein LD39_00830 [Halobacillus sp. BBL2006]
MPLEYGTGKMPVGYNNCEAVTMTLERYEDMKEELKEYEDILQRFFTVTEKEDHVSVIVHLDEIEKWSKKTHARFYYPNSKQVESVAYVGVNPNGPK